MFRSAFPEGLVIYQIYPRSFKDSNDDGIGDVPGIISKLDYLKELGITAIWLNPIFPSPMADFGYDVAKYCAVDPTFGTMQDLDRLIKEAHRRHIHVMLDMVFNHTSEEHTWFKDSRSSRNSPKRDWYIWQDPKPDGSVPNNWLSAFGGSAWQFEEQTGQYYLHSFLKEQPDLNWRNKEVRQKLRGIIRFWLDKGIDGLRMDAVYYYGKDARFRDDPVNQAYQLGRDDPSTALIHKYSTGHPDTYKFLNELAAELTRYKNRFMIMEVTPQHPLDPSGYTEFYKRVNYLVAAPFNFETFFMPWDARSFREHIDAYQKKLRRNYTPIYVLGNHDKSRLASRYGQMVAPASALLLLTLPGAPVIYYGEEIGMEDVRIPKNKIQDTFARNNPGLALGRDPSRTPMQWSNKKYAGFSNAEPWLPIAADYKNHNVASQAQDAGSLFNVYKQLLHIRHHSDALKYGKYKPLALGNKDVFGFSREYKKDKLRIMINFSDKKIYDIDTVGQLVFSTIGARHQAGQLAPNEGIVLGS